MSQVNQSTANWRLYGGGGLGVGGGLVALATLLGKDSSDDIWFWLYIIGLAAAGIGLFFVARGETGSNGAVGADQTGKLALYAAGGLFVLEAFLLFLVHEGNNVDSSLFDIIQLVTIVALGVAAYSIANKGVAKGLAALALYAVAGWALVIQILDWADEYNWWTAFILGLTLLGTGVLYVLNN